MKRTIIFTLLALVATLPLKAQDIAPLISGDTIIYKLTIAHKTVNYSGKAIEAMAVNGSIPAPTLEFEEGKFAVIHVTNSMNVESSIHWHGLILPNYEDGVPYLNSPPIKPGQTHAFRFPLVQSGTYWYHSHTGLQEQRGVYGSIIIHPKEKQLEYDHDLVLVLSDWTDENPNEVLRTLKRGSEWYSVQKGTVQSLNKVIRKKALGAQLKLWKQHMPGMDISDVYYDAFLINGKLNQEYPSYQAGEVIRLRIINAAAASYFWLAFGGETPTLISADGIDVQPIRTNKVLHAIAETYDFLITIPANNALEFKATAQDGSGMTTAIFGKGEVLRAPSIPKPDLVEQMKMMSKMDMSGTMSEMDMDKMHMDMEPTDSLRTDHSHHQMGGMTEMKLPEEVADYSYEALRSIEPTTFPKLAAVKDIEMSLTGNMWRYVWSMDKRVLSEVDMIQIKRGEVIRLTLKNKTMMHHPMHLHGHFFRVLNKNGEYSPQKHTVDVPPMGSVTIEFEANETGDWFFHCHVLYHMKGGMARVFSYADPRDERMQDHPLKKVLTTDKHWFKWGETSLMSNRADLSLSTSNTRNQILLDGSFSWANDQYEERKNLEIEALYERFIGDYLRIYVGADIENETPNNLVEIEAVGRVGIRYLLPYFIDMDLSIDHRARPQLGLEYELLLFPKLELFTAMQWQLDLVATEELPRPRPLNVDHEWNAGLNYTLSKNFSLVGSYDDRFGWGVGINWRM